MAKGMIDNWKVTYYNENWQKVESDLFSIIDKDADMFTQSGCRIITLDWVKKLANFCWVRESSNPPPNLFCTPSETNRQQHIWGLFVEFIHKPEVKVFSEGEASQLNTGKFETIIKEEDWVKVRKQKNIEAGQISWMYKSSMAYKRAYTRWVLKLLGVTWIYGEIEASDFERSAQTWEIQLDYWEI